jgi:hypothetical protein
MRIDKNWQLMHSRNLCVLTDIFLGEVNFLLCVNVFIFPNEFIHVQDIFFLKTAWAYFLRYVNFNVDVFLVNHYTYL